MEAEAYANLYKIEEELWWYRGRRKICFDLLARFLPPAESRRILDVGCGTGYNLTPLRRFGQAQGVEMAEEALRFCHARGEYQVTHHEAENLPFADQEFDLLTAFDVIEHIPDDQRALSEFCRLLVPGGWLLIYTPALPWMYNEHDRRVHHQRRYRKGELRQKLTSAGFQIEHLSYSNLLVLPLVLAARLFYKIRPTDHAEMELPPPLINQILTQICKLESRLVVGPGLPYGMSLVALARRPPSR